VEATTFVRNRLIPSTAKRPKYTYGSSGPIRSPRIEFVARNMPLTAKK